MQLPHTQAWACPHRSPGAVLPGTPVWMERVQALRLHAGVESSDSTLSLNAPQQETDKLGGGLPLLSGGILDASA